MPASSRAVHCYLFLVIALLAIGVLSASLNRRRVRCSEIPQPVLSEILGPAFNSRYMSINQPLGADSDASDAGSPKRTPTLEPAFYVDDHFAEELSDLPAWKTSHVVRKDVGAVTRSIEKRAVKPVRQWECESKIRWQDLGPEYFPRYVRSVECTSRGCWYDMLRCRPRSFTVKLLRKKRDRCVPADGLVSSIGRAQHQQGSVGLPQELRELWVWEERALNFCCDCAL